MAKNRLLTVGLIMLVGILLIWVFMPLIMWPSNLSVRFYDPDGNLVGSPLRVHPLAPVTVGGVEVASFEMQIRWHTNDPSITHIRWGVALRVYYLVYEGGIDNPTRVVESEVFEGTIWEDTKMIGTGGVTASDSWDSIQYSIATYAAMVPEDTVFYMEFYGTVVFIDGHVDPFGVAPKAEVILAPVLATLKHEDFEYTAQLGLPW